MVTKVSHLLCEGAILQLGSTVEGRYDHLQRNNLTTMLCFKNVNEQLTSVQSIPWLLSVCDKTARLTPNTNKPVN